MSFAKINGIDLYYEVHGKGHPLVLCAGFSCDTHYWNLLLPYLASHFQVIIYDNRCVGQSTTADEAFTVDDLADDVLGLMHHLKIEKAHVLGHSMGGAIVQSLAYRYPDNIERLIIANSLVKFSQAGVFTLRLILKLKQTGVDKRSIVEVVMPWLFSNKYLSNKDSVEQFIQASLNNSHPQTEIGFARQLEALTKFDSRQWFYHIQKPVLVMEGDQDLMCPFDAKVLTAGLPEAVLYTFSQMGHMPFIEAPEHSARIIRDFLYRDDREKSRR